MYTQYTAVREIKDRTVFMYTQYTIRFGDTNYSFESGFYDFYDFIWRI